MTARADQIIYDNALENGWQNWGWATLNYANPSPVHSGSDSVSVTIAPLLGHSSTVMTARYAHLSDRMLREATTKAGRLLAVTC